MSHFLQGGLVLTSWVLHFVIVDMDSSYMKRNFQLVCQSHQVDLDTNDLMSDVKIILDLIQEMKFLTLAKSSYFMTIANVNIMIF